MHKRANNQEGQILAYTLLVVSLITAIAIAMSIIVMNEIRLTGSARDATLAYYAAESGIERGLYTVKLMRADGTSTLNDAITELQSYTDVSLSENDAEYTDEGSSVMSTVVEHRVIREEDFLQVDYYDLNDPLVASADEVVTVDIQNGTVGNNPDDATWAEVSWTAWDSSGELLTSTSAKKVLGHSDLEIDVLTERGWQQSLAGAFSPSDPVGYRLRVKPLFGDLTDFSLVPRKAGGSQLGAGDLPTQIQIKSVGTRGKFKQSLTATIPWKVPLFGLYDYVLYSEGDILKDIILSSPVYSSGTIQAEADIPAAYVCDYSSCAACQGAGWTGLECLKKGEVYCRGSGAGSGGEGEPEGTCEVSADLGQWGYVYPIPDTVPEGDEYYVSVKLGYYSCIPDGGACPDTDNAQGRDVAVEISGQSSILDDQAETLGRGVEVWRTCTIPVTYQLGDPSLPANDPSRTLRFTVHPYEWANPALSDWRIRDYVYLDWYQLSTYKIFEDCE